MIKTREVQLLSLRAKFKSTNSVEVVVIDSKTNEIYAIHWDFRKGKVEATEAMNADEQTSTEEVPTTVETGHQDPEAVTTDPKSDKDNADEEVTGND